MNEILLRIILTLAIWGGAPVKVVRAQSTDGQVYRAVDGGYHVSKSATTAYKQMMQWGGEGGGAQRLTRPYDKSVWVMRAINIVSGPISALPLQFFANKRAGDTLLTDGPVVEFWEEPFQGISRVAGMKETFNWLQLDGNAFWIKDDSWLGSGAKSKLIIARPDRMTPMVESGTLLGWTYRDGAGRARILLTAQVEHIKLFNPYHDILGLAPWEAARMATEADYFASRYNRNLMENSGDQGAYVISKTGVMTSDQQAQIINQLREKKRMAAAGHFKVAFLSADCQIEDPKVSTPDANYVSIRLENRHEIYIAFGVPPSMGEVMASYSIGSASDRARLIDETSMPLSAQGAEHIENVSRSLGEGRATRIWAGFDWDQNSVVQQIRRERIDAATKYWDRGMPWQIANDILDLGLKPFKGWDKGYVSFGLAEVGGETLDDNSIGSEENTAAADNADQAIQECLTTLRRSSRSKSKKTVRIPVNCGCAGFVGKSAKWQSHMAKRRATIKAYESKFNKALIMARAEVLAKIDKAGRVEMVRAFDGDRLKAAAGDFSFDLTKWKKDFLFEMRKAGTNALKEAGTQLFQEIGKDDPFTMPPVKALDFLNVRQNKLSGVADEVFQRVTSALQDGLTDGDSMSQLANRIRTEFNGISKARAMVVASTETGAAYGVSRDEAMKQAGVQYKQWLTSGNGNVRASHAEAEGQIVPMDQPFQVGGADLMFPGDPDGPPEEVINCHCVQIASAYSTEDEA